MTWLRSSRNRECSVFMAAVLLTTFITLVVIRPRRLAVDASRHTSPKPKPSTTEAQSITPPPPVQITSPEPPSRTVRLDIGDVADLLRRLQNTAAVANSQHRADEEAVARRVSQRLNDALKAYQQGRCRTPGIDFTDTGAWCQRAVASLHIMDKQLAETLARFLAGRTVLSLGDGTGVYRELILNTSLVCHQQILLVSDMIIMKYKNYNK